MYFIREEKISEDSLELIPFPSPSVKIPIIGGKSLLEVDDKQNIAG